MKSKFNQRESISLQEAFEELDRIYEENDDWYKKLKPGKVFFTEEAEEQLLKEAEEDTATENTEEANQEQEAKSSEQEPENMIQDLKDAPNYAEFVKILDKDVKSQAFVKYLQQHYKTGDDTIQTVKAAKASETVAKCTDLIPTQNNISLSKSLKMIKDDVNWSLKIINTPKQAFKDPTIIYAGKYIIDGHHRWSKAYALNGGECEIAVINFPAIEGVTVADMLKATQLAIITTNPDAPLINGVGDDNMLSSSKEEVEKYVEPIISEEVVNALVEKGRGSNKEEVVDKIGDNIVNGMQKTSQPVSGASDREYMPQTDKAEGSVDLMSKAIIDLTESVAKTKNVRAQNLLKRQSGKMVGRK